MIEPPAAARFDNDGFKRTANCLSTAIIVTDPAGKITWANRAFRTLCGYTLKEAKGKKPSSFLQGPGTDPSTVDALRKAVQDCDYLRVDILNYHKNGHPYWAHIAITPYFDEHGELEGHVGVAQNITRKQVEIKQMKQDLIRMYTTLVNECSNCVLRPNDPFRAKSGVHRANRHNAEVVGPNSSY